jgi:hypothetical protein
MVLYILQQLGCELTIKNRIINSRGAELTRIDIMTIVCNSRCSLRINPIASFCFIILLDEWITSVRINRVVKLFQVQRRLVCRLAWLGILVGIYVNTTGRLEYFVTNQVGPV